MNPLTNVRNITKLNERELSLGIDMKNSWHNMYSSSAWIFIGGLNYELSEGDVITVFSQYGEVVNVNLIRDQKTGKSKGFCFLCYEDQRSTVLAVDNLNGIKLVNRIIRVDHVMDYKIPKEHEDMDEATLALHNEGCAPQERELITPRLEDSKQVLEINIKIKKKHKKRRHRSSSSDSSSASSDSPSKRRKHKSKSRDKRRDERRHDSHKWDQTKSDYKSDRHRNEFKPKSSHSRH